MKTVTVRCGLVALGLMLASAGGCDNFKTSPSPGQGNSSILGGLGSSPPPPQVDEDQYTIVLRPLCSVEEAELFRRNLTDREHWKNVFVIHKTGHSELCWGTYRSTEAAQDDLRKARAFVPPRSINGETVFPGAAVVVLPGKNPGPPEWDLSAARGDYTVMVAEFHDDPDADYFGRKKNAVMYCQQLREQGNDAYYSHDPAKSWVYVGAFPASAIVKREMDDGIIRQVVADKKMLDVLHTFPFLAVNGRAWKYKTYAGGKEVVLDVATYPVPIPKRGGMDVFQPTSRPGNAK